MKYHLPPVNAQPLVALGPDAILIADGSGKSAAVQSDDERSLLALVDGKRTVAEILRVSRMSGFVTMRQLRSLSERKIIRPVSKQAEASFGRTTARFGPPRAGHTQDLTAVAQIFAPAAAEDVPTPLPQVIAPPPRSLPRRATPPMPAPRARATNELAPVAAEINAPPPRPIPRRETPPMPAPAPAPKPTGELVPIAAEVIPPSRALARPITTPPKLGEMAAQAVELWFSLTKRDWATLALVPGHKAGSALALACAIAEAGSAIRRKPIDLICAEGRDLVPTTDWVFRRQPGDQHQRVIALDPVGINPMVIPVAQAAQAVLVVVDRGESDLSTVRRTVEAIGRDKVTGVILVSPPKAIKLR